MLERTLSYADKSKVPVYDVIKSSYKSPKVQEQTMKQYGYVRDGSLSNHNEQVYYNPSTKKMIFSVTGTHNLSDWGTNLYLALGMGKSTNRYKEAHSKIREAKEKYKPTETSVTGHSQGGYTAGMISSKTDKVYTLDKAATVGQKVRNNETHYRTNGDAVSLLNANSKHTVNLKNDNLQTGILPFDAYRAHDVGNVKGKHIYV